MKNRIALKLSLSRAVLLAVAAIAALAGPIIIGIANVKAAGAQSEPAVRAVANPIGIVEERPSSPRTAELQGPQTALAEITRAPQGGRGGALPSSVIQGYRFGEIKVTGAKSFPAELIPSSLGLVSGEVFDESRLRQGLEDLKRLYGQNGYAEFVVVPVLDIDEQKKAVNLTVNIDEGRRFVVNRITFTGNTITPVEVLRRELTLNEGGIFNASALERSVLRLNQLGIVEEITIGDVRIETAMDEPKLDIKITVKEKAR